MKQAKILIVDDERDILDLLDYNLSKSGYEVYRAKNGEKALKLALNHLPNLILLDVMMPGPDGIETCRRMREHPELRQAIIAFLTARDEEYVEVAAFEAGGDDFIRKPIMARALRSRVDALLRRHLSQLNGASHKVLRVGNLKIDREAHVVYKEDQPITLTRKEFNLLYLLASQPGKVFGRDDILRSIWKRSEVSERTIDVHILKLRQKVGGEYIETLKGLGYRFLA